MSKLLFDEAPLVVDTVLATKIGVDAALVLQQIHYWIEINRKKNNNFHEGAYWTYNSIKEWNKCFPFYGERTIQRIFKKLKDLGILKVGNFNIAKFDKTSWYSIDYDRLTQVVEGSKEEVEPSRQNGVIEETKSANDGDKMAQRERQIGVTTATEWRNEDDKMAEPIPEISTEISTKTSTEASSASKLDDDRGKKNREGVQKVFEFFESNFYLPKQYDVEVMISWCKNYPIPIILEAMKEAKRYNARNLNYIESILITWTNEGIATVEALESYKIAKVTKGVKNDGSSKSNISADGSNDKYSNVGLSL